MGRLFLSLVLLCLFATNQSESAPTPKSAHILTIVDVLNGYCDYDWGSFKGGWIIFNPEQNSYVYSHQAYESGTAVVTTGQFYFDGERLILHEKLRFIQESTVIITHSLQVVSFNYPEVVLRFPFVSMDPIRIRKRTP